ncbi:MAG: HD-GYP domain-containing protein, partial [Gammaproteobacteria bacterium]|nr:HD-GYP domain-containing protein [Gammaproteobacteria bacterium]
MPPPSFDKQHKQYQEHKIPVNELALGMFVTQLDKPWEESSFLFQGFMITNKNELSALQEECEYVYVRASVNSTNHTQTNQVNYINKIRLSDEMSNARSAYQDACSDTKIILDTMRLSGNLDIKRINKIVDDMVDSVLKNKGAMLLLSQIKNKDEYTAEHSLRVGLFSAALGKELGLKPLEIKNLGTCGLLHDIGKVKVPIDILNKPGAFTGNEYETMKAHTTYGKKLLIGKSGIYAGAVDTAFSHHERLDGKGYPRGVNSEKIPYFAKIVAIVAIADTYDAITSHRCYKDATPSIKAFEILFKNCDTSYEKALVETFIKMMG